MQPSKDQDFVQVPLTFNSRYRGSDKKGSRLLFGFLYILLFIIGTIVSMTRDTFGSKLTVFLVVTVVVVYLFRFHIFSEMKYRESLRQIKKNDFLFDIDLLWGITDITENFPSVCTLTNGQKAIFVAMKKGVTVGKGGDYFFEHQNVIADAYKLLSDSNVEFSFIDYMDNLGNDSRIETLFEDVTSLSADAPNLRDLMTMQYSYLELTMTKTFTSYDVFVFYYKPTNEEAWVDIESALGILKNANYDSYRVMGKQEIAQFASTLYGLNGLSFNHAQDLVHGKSGLRKRLTVIWKDINGVRTQVNKTSALKAKEERIKRAEKSVKKPKLRKKGNDDILD